MNTPKPFSPTRHGILAAGNWIVDLVKIIDAYPVQDALANILDEKQGNGGSPYNILKDMARLGATFPLQGVGLLGDDENGRFILDDCQANGIDTSNFVIDNRATTSYTSVMSVKNTGRRTFFHMRGANAQLDRLHIPLEKSQAKIFHLGYLLLLDKLDELYADGRTNASILLEEALAMGFMTSADVVSESSDRFRSVVPPALPYLDVLFVNEYEAERITGITIGKDKYIDLEHAEDAAIALLEMGVRQWVVLHFPEGAMAVNADVGTVYQPSVQVPANRIVGAAGAGDAFASGVLYGLHEGYEMQECLKLGVCAAATSLFDASCSNGVLKKDDALAVGDAFGFYSYS